MGYVIAKIANTEMQIVQKSIYLMEDQYMSLFK